MAPNATVGPSQQEGESRSCTATGGPSNHATAALCEGRCLPGEMAHPIGAQAWLAGDPVGGGRIGFGEATTRQAGWYDAVDSRWAGCLA